MKRCFDFSCAAIGLLILSPLLLALAICIRLKLGSPILFCQERVGLHNQIFCIYKFRTMTDERDENGHLLPDEKRLSEFGKFLRRMSLDELPQLWNVLRGQISLVGPRPLLPQYLPRYTKEQLRRHLVRPGITGWAQVNGRNSLSWEEKFRLDVWYVDHRSFALDLKILWLTVLKVLCSEGISMDGHATMVEFKGRQKGMETCNILFTSAGRRVSLVKHFKQSLASLGLSGNIVTADLLENAPAHFFADVQEIVPRVDDPSYIATLCDICKRHQISLLIPLIDTELTLLSLHRQTFESLGVTVMVSSPETNTICFDKRNTHDFFKTIGVHTPALIDPKEVLADLCPSFPFLIKPARGSSSVGVTKINSKRELEFFMEYVPDAILQEFITGQEYTVDVLVDFQGNVRCVVPRLRISTRAGEVSKGMTVKNHLLMLASKYVVESLPGAVGCITVQCFLTKHGEVQFIEINPRFGGGFPLALEAGADFPKWILQMHRGESPEIALDGWEDGTLMLRYDDAVFIKKDVVV